jgi:hypothetical protein
MSGTARGHRKYQREGIEGEQAESNKSYNDYINNLTQTTVGGLRNPQGSSDDQYTTGNRAVPRDGGAGSVSPRYNELLLQGAGERDYLTGGLRGMSETGGLSDDDIAKFRASYQGALGGSSAGPTPDFEEERRRYRDFADTGGYTDKDIQRTRAQAARSAPSLYGALRDQQNLAQTRMGGANASAGAVDFKSARQAAQQAGQDKLAANIGLSESQRAGKQFGIQGLESTQTTIGDQGLRRAGLVDNYNLNSAGMAADMEAQILGLRQQGKQFGLGSLQNLYANQDYAPLQNFQGNWLGAIGARGDATRQNRQLNLSNDEINRSRWPDRVPAYANMIMKGVSGVGGMMG